MKSVKGEPASVMRPKAWGGTSNWLMVFVVVVMVMGLLLMVTDNFGGAKFPGVQNFIHHGLNL